MKIWELGGLALFVFTAIIRSLEIDFIKLLIWVVGCLTISLVSLIIGIKQNNKL